MLMIIFSAAVLIFSMLTTLWFGLSFAVLVQGIADGSMRDQAHMVFGVIAAALEALAVAGWLWALSASARVGSPLNSPVQTMCGVTALVQFVTALASVALIGDRFWDAPSSMPLGHAVTAVSLAILVRRAEKRQRIAHS